MSGKLIGFTDEEFKEKVNEVNQELVEDFLSQETLSDQTLKQYKSALYIFCTWVYNECKNKPIPELRPRDARKYQDWLIKQGLSSSAIKFKRSAVSSLCGFIELYYDREYPMFRNIYSKAIKNVPKARKKEKIPLTGEEVEKIISTLEKRGEWQKLAYVCFTYSTGCRREESRQLLAEVGNYEKYTNKNGEEKDYYVTHTIRCKGAGKVGKERKFKFDQRAKDAIKKWLEYRATLVDVDDCPYVFVTKRNGKYKQVSANTFNLWCQEFSEIIGGKAVHPHLFRSSRATIAVVEEGHDIESVKKLLGHNSVETTQIYVVRDDTEDDDDLF